MSQPLFFYRIEDVRSVVAAFDAAPNARACSSYQREKMHEDFCRLRPEVRTEDGTELISVAAVNKVLEDHACYKLTAHCGQPQNWMRAWFKERRVALLPENEKPINQCDGCRRGLPLENGTHRAPKDPKKSGWLNYDMIGCTAHLYKE